MTDSRSFVISRENWSLHRKGYEDQQRHQEKVNETIRKNLPDLITDESIIMSDGKEIVKIPIRSLDEYRFRYNFNKQRLVGQGKGNSQVGDVVAQDRLPQEGEGMGSAGDQPGEDYYEAEVDVEQLENMLFEELELPYLEPKEIDQLTVEETEFNDIRKKGLMGNVDKKRTILEAIKRNALAGNKQLKQISVDDLRFKTWDEVIKPRTNAVVIAMMDTSGSMGLFEKYCARSFYFWMLRFLRSRYDRVEIVYIAHHTEAKEVSEEAFFTKGESGGTLCSSAYRKALEVIDERYPPQHFNIYPLHFSDGDNLTSDNELCLQLVGELMEKANMFGYSEVNQYQRRSTLMSIFRSIEDARFRYALIRDKSEVYTALKTIFSSREEEVV